MFVFCYRNDWGALILVDERFGKNPNKYVKGTARSKQQIEEIEPGTKIPECKDPVSWFMLNEMKLPRETFMFYSVYIDRFSRSSSAE